MATFVLIHGAYQGGWIWSPVATRLRAAGHSVYAPSLDGCAERSAQARAGIDTESHADEIAELLRYEDLSEVVLVGTSSGGMVLTRVAELARERIQRVVFVDALALVAGETIRDIVTRPPESTTAVASGPARWRDAGHAAGEHGAGAGRMGRGSLGVAPGRGVQSTGGARLVLGPVVGRVRDLVPPGAESRGGAPAPLRGGARRALARARHGPLPNAEHARGADAADSRGVVGLGAYRGPLIG